MCSKLFKSLLVSLFLGLFLQSTVFAQSNSSSEKFKEYLNDVVQQVEKEDDFTRKRAILNDSFEDMMTAYKSVSSMNGISEEDQKGIAELQQKLTTKMDELNGRNGYKAIADAQLDEFANYVQNDLEQANTITLSLTTALLIILILILI